MKLSKTKKILLLGTTLTLLTTSIALPIVLLNKNEKKDENDVEKLFKILQAKTTKEKIIELSSNATGKIVANNQDKIIEKIKTLIGKTNSKDVKIEVLMRNDINVSNTPQKITIKLTKNEVSKEIKDFSVKKQSIIDVDKDIAAIKNILDSKSGNDLIITLPSPSSGNIIENITNKNAIIKKLRILIDPSNTNGEINHPSLRGTSIEISMSVDAPISTTPQDIIVSISKSGGTTVNTTNTFQVKRAFTADEDIQAIMKIFRTKERSNDSSLHIILPSSANGSIINNPTIKNAIEKKARELIDSSNTNGDPNHISLRGTKITLTRVISSNDLISNITPRVIVITISKTGGTSVNFSGFVVRKL